jgi:predicted HicB family RNase H-like nuclease
MKKRGRTAKVIEAAPTAPITKMITLRLDIPTYNSVVMSASVLKKSLNQFLVDLIEKHNKDANGQT